MGKKVFGKGGKGWGKCLAKGHKDRGIGGNARQIWQRAMGLRKWQII